MHVYNTCKPYIYGFSFMISSAIRHVLRYPKLRRRLLQYVLLTFFLWSTADILLVQRHYHEEQTHTDFKPPERQRIYIASIFWSNEQTLSSHWNEAVVELANVFGPDNIFVSVYESGSNDGTKDHLRELDRVLDTIGVQRNIALSDVAHQDEVSMTPIDNDWSDHPPGEKEFRRTYYLSRLRNMSLRPLHDLRDIGTLFDRVLFLSDVIFTSQDVLSLLNTNYGTYAAACSFDILAPRLYDTSALRDADGHERVMQEWPYFRSSRSRNAMKSMLPVPVKSCWDAMVFMRTDSFYSNPPLQFRGVPDSLAANHVAGSECCLIHADDSLSKRKGVYLNPFVRVGHDAGAVYSASHPASHWLSAWEIFRSLWENRLRRWFTFPSLNGWTLRKRIAQWGTQEENNLERGDFCLVDKIQAVRT
ncbi:cryptococcal mannosyltransferase 1-domain-containing protein [Aspergillus cavernicola]|uniref:Cryptococcal mannosyltransferase 1-domain-containing protein n=1 Tax=Aspergillus cavernicola TaxID=176166 RepID=A0ABR4IU05_9EURO